MRSSFCLDIPTWSAGASGSPRFAWDQAEGPTAMRATKIAAPGVHRFMALNSPPCARGPERGPAPRRLIGLARQVEEREGAVDMRRGDRPRRSDVGFVEGGKARDAEQRETDRNLVLEDFEQPHDAGAARRDDLGEDIDRAEHVIELAAAMVRHIDAIDAELDRAPGVLGRGDALQDQRDVEFRLVAFDIAPAVPRLKDTGVVAHDNAAALVALGDVPLAAAVAVGVDGHAEGVIAGVDRATDVVVDPVVVAEDVKLKDLEAVARGLGCCLQAGMGDTAQDHAVAELGGRLGDRCAAARLKAFERADRRQQYRDAQFAAEQAGAGVDLRDVAEHPRAEGQRIERHAVARDARLGLRGTDQVIPCVPVEVGARRLDEFVQVLKAVCERFGHGGLFHAGLTTRAPYRYDAALANQARESPEEETRTCPAS